MKRNQFLRILEMCVEECEHQQVGPKEVENLIKAYLFAIDAKENGAEITPSIVLTLAAMIEPEKCKRGYRRVNLQFPPDAVDHNNIPHNVEEITNYPSYGARYLYVELMKIHPFLDGNGRVGFILYNWRDGTLDRPQPSPTIDWDNPYYE